jgi:hypothetical protein
VCEKQGTALKSAKILPLTITKNNYLQQYEIEIFIRFYADY